MPRCAGEEMGSQHERRWTFPQARVCRRQDPHLPRMHERVSRRLLRTVFACKPLSEVHHQASIDRGRRPAAAPDRTRSCGCRRRTRCSTYAGFHRRRLHDLFRLADQDLGVHRAGVGRSPLELERRSSSSDDVIGVEKWITSGETVRMAPRVGIDMTRSTVRRASLGCENRMTNDLCCPMATCERTGL